MIKGLSPDDLCVTCAHCCLLRPVGERDAPAICVRGWPYTDVFWNAISGCPEHETTKKEMCDAQ